MTESEATRAPARVIVLADAEGSAQALIERVLRPAGIQAWPEAAEAPPPDVFVVDITQVRGDPLAALRNRRSSGDEAPAIVLAAHFPPARLRDLFRLGVADVLLKPYRPVDLVQSIFEIGESRSAQANTKLLARRLEAAREQIRRRTEEMRLLSEIGRAVVSLSDLDMILRRVVEAAAYLTDAEESNLYLADPEQNDVVLRASKQAGDRQATLPRLRTTDSLAGEVYRTGQPVLRQPSIEGGPVKVQTGFLVQSLIKVPLRMQEEVVGVLGVYNRLAPRRFTEHHMTLLLSLAAWAGVALEHAALLRRARALQAEAQPSLVEPSEAADLETELHRALVLLEPLLRGELGPVSSAQRAQLRALAEHLDQMRSPSASVVPEEAPLPALLRSVAEALRPAAERQGLDLLVSLNDAFGGAPPDPARTRQLVEGMLSSALGRTEKGKITLEARPFEVFKGNGSGVNIPAGVHLHDGRWAAVTVTDTGPGLPPDALRALHTSAADPALGTIGPGLTMGELRLIAESLGGVLWHDRAVVGTRLVFALPAE